MQKPEELVEKITKEEQELDIKLSNLECFMMSADFIKVSPEQKTLLEQQHKVMTEYKLILIKRAHRINWEAGRNSMREEINNLQKDKRWMPSAPPTFEVNPALCEKCAHPKGGYSTCHDCELGSNYKPRNEEKDCRDCANSLDGGKHCTGDKEHGWVDTTGEKKCFAPKEPDTERLEPHVFAAMEYEAWKKKQEAESEVPSKDFCSDCPYYNKAKNECTNRNRKDGKCWIVSDPTAEKYPEFPRCPFKDENTCPRCINLRGDKCSSPDTICYKSARTLKKEEEDGTPSDK